MIKDILWGLDCTNPLIISQPFQITSLESQLWVGDTEMSSKPTVVFHWFPFNPAIPSNQKNLIQNGERTYFFFFKQLNYTKS